VRARREDGFALIVLVVAIFVILLFLSIAAPLVARDLQREKELEAVHRGNQYVRAIQLYYRKFNHYPTSVDQLEKSNNIRFLRRKYEDPLTGKADWRIIHAGENKTTVKGLFGQPLAGIGGAGLGGSGIGGSQTIAGTSNPGAFGSTGSTGSSFGSSSSPIGGGSTTVSGTSGAGSSGGIGSQSATSFQGGGGPIMGFGSSKTGDSILVLNEQDNYEDWEFLYDPRIEQLKAKSSLFGGGVGGSGGSGGGLGSGFGTPGTGIGGATGSTGSPFGSGPTFGSPTAPTAPATPTTPQ
jgi:type II secretory pathway pseudopilin PulG